MGESRELMTGVLDKDRYVLLVTTPNNIQFISVIKMISYCCLASSLAHGEFQYCLFFLLIGIYKFKARLLTKSALFLFLFLSSRYIKSSNILDRLSSEIYVTCDRLLGYIYARNLLSIDFVICGLNVFFV